MTDLQSITERMAKTVLRFLDNNTSLFSGNPMFISKRDALKAKLSEISSTAGSTDGFITATTSKLNSAFDELNTTLTDLDDMVALVRFSEPIFFEGYIVSRKRIDTGSRHIAAQIRLVDKVTGADLGQGIIEVLPIGLTKETGSDSTVHIYDSETGLGTFNFTARAQHYKDALVSNIIIEEGKVAHVEIEMEAERL